MTKDYRYTIRFDKSEYESIREVSRLYPPKKPSTLIRDAALADVERRVKNFANLIEEDKRRTASKS